MSPSLACSIATFESTIEPTVAVRQLRTKDSAYFLSVVITSVLASVALIVSSTLSLVNPNWVRMKDGVFCSTTTRRSEKAASSAVNGLPEWNSTQIGSASCRARVCQYVSISVVAVSIKKTHINETATSHNYNTQQITKN